MLEICYVRTEKKSFLLAARVKQSAWSVLILQYCEKVMQTIIVEYRALF